MSPRGILWLNMIGLLLSASACNADIFLDREEVPEYMSATIEGDGGEVSFIIPTGRLLHLGFGNLSVNPDYVTYYDIYGDIIAQDSPADDVASIVFKTDFVQFEVVKQGNVLHMRSVYNTIGRECNWPIWLEYDFGIRNIDVISLPGRRLSLVGTYYADDFKLHENAWCSETKLRVNNNGQSSSSVEVRPYLNEVASVMVSSSDDSGWIEAEELYMPVPICLDGTWKLSDVQISPGVKYKYICPEHMTKVEITIPPDSDVNVVTRVNYSSVEGYGTLDFLNEVSGVHLYAGFNVTSLYPISHEIFIEDAP